MVTEGVMTKPPPSPTTPVFVRISDQELTEIELHSVESINDLHRIHPDQNHHKGSRRPPLPHPPSTNGNLHQRGVPVVCQTGHPMRRRWRGCLQDMLPPTSLHYSVGCAVVSLMLLTLFLIFYFLVQQGGALRSLTEAVRERQAAAMEISQLIQELQALRYNLTAQRNDSH